MLIAGVCTSGLSRASFAVHGACAARSMPACSHSARVPGCHLDSATPRPTDTVTQVLSAKGAVYKGPAFGTNKQGNFPFATNFAAGTVEVYDKTFPPVSPPGLTSDWGALRCSPWGGVETSQAPGGMAQDTRHPVIGALPLQEIDTALAMKVVEPTWRRIP
jgi:hypothetical protein